MTRTLILLAVALALAGGSADRACARSLRDLGGALAYPGKKIVKNANHNAKHVTGDPNRRRHARGHKSHRHR